MNLDAFNALPPADAEHALLACCTAPRWAERVAAGRPYPTVDAVHAAAEAALTDADVADGLTGHLRIGDRGPDARSRREQSGVAGAPPEVLAALDEGNRRYEERFGHVYLVSASGRGGEELLAVLRQRLGNDPTTERAVIRRELAAINRLRLAALFAAGPLSTHVLDAALGRPAAGVAVRLLLGEELLAEAKTDDDGRVRALGPDLVAGTYRLVFATGEYFAATAPECFYPEVVVTFTVTDPARHHHVPLLLSPFAYSTYRGS
jgi:2-oxo-4-hydroxy-4-carboxy-5-ureidoimidazoline decarboxylase